MNFYVLLENSMYLLALLNPASKVMFLATYEPALSSKQVRELSWKSSLAALIILCFLAWTGEFVLSKIFRVDLYSLKITGGLILFTIGFLAVRQGHFVNQDTTAGHGPQNFTDISLVPLAAPLIAGPGTIAASISSTAETGFPLTALSLFIAIFINFIIMLFSASINRVLTKLHMLGPLIRFTGLIISAVAIQMIIAGVKECRIFN